MGSSLARILAAVVLVASLAVLVARHPPHVLSARIDAVRESHDPWAAYLAPEGVCPGGGRTDLSVVEQDRVMVCLLAHARESAGLKPLPVVYPLNRSSVLKAMDIVHCSDFSHTACGLPFASVFEQVGYSGATGENIAWGAAAVGAPRSIVAGWLNSRHHRENLFSRDWTEQGLALVPAQDFLGARTAQVWVNEFGAPASVASRAAVVRDRTRQRPAPSRP
jgi:uncharacterized protein YkwD